MRRSGAPVDLTTVEFDLLAALMRVAGSTVSREDLVRNVLGRDFSPFDRSIDTHVCNLRRKLGPLEDGGERIKGVRGAGYLYASPAKPGAQVRRLFLTIFLWFWLTLLAVALIFAAAVRARGIRIQIDAAVDSPRSSAISSSRRESSAISSAVI